MKHYKNLSAKHIIIAVVILLAGASLLAYALRKPNNKPNSPGTSGTTLPIPQEDKSGSGSIQNETNKNGSDTSKPGTGSLTITNFSEDSANVYIRAITNDTTTGTCKLELSKSGQPTVSRSAKLIFVTSYYSCEGFNISKTDIPASGVWTASVKIEGSSAPAATASLNITK